MKICNKHYSTYLCLDANIFVIPTLEDNFNSTPWEQTFEFNSKDSSDDDSGNVIDPIVVEPITPIIK